MNSEIVYFRKVRTELVPVHTTEEIVQLTLPDEAFKDEKTIKVIKNSIIRKAQLIGFRKWKWLPIEKNNELTTYSLKRIESC